MPVDLRGPISSYFKAKNAQDIDAMLAPFSRDAIVNDEDQDHVGLVAIRAWMEETTRKYHVAVDVQGVTTANGNIVVSALVSGEFPTSPAMLRYTFTLAGGAIAALKISA